MIWGLFMDNNILMSSPGLLINEADIIRNAVYKKDVFARAESLDDISIDLIKALQEKLPAGQFIQPHKSYLVNIQCIQSIEGNILHIGGKYQIPISKYQKEEIMERIVNDKLLKK